jgi:hypothetical protein
MKRIVIVLLALLLVQRGICATRNAASPSYSDVNFAVNGGGPDSNGVTFNGAAADGDIVVIPAGTASWTSGLTITHGITLQGQTVITGDHTATPMAATNGTIIQDDVPRTASGGGAALISYPILTQTQSARITGLTLQYGLSVTSFNFNGIVRLNGTCPSFRIDNCYFNQLYGYACATSGWLYGVVDHCIFDVRDDGGAVLVNHNAWGNQVNGWGSWAEPAYFGSEKFIFLEDNTVNSFAVRPAAAVPGGKWGGRYVLRYNVINNAPTWPHGTEDRTNRGVRAAEIYNNAYFATRQMGGGQCRGGTMLLHDNTYAGQSQGSIALTPLRLFEQAGGAGTGSDWGGADGTDPWDLNATEPDGTHVDGHAPYTFATGTHIGPNVPSNPTEIVTVSGNPWTPNQWAGYTITNTTSGSQYYLGHGYISSNTTNTLTVAATAIVPPNLAFNTGDTFAIHKVLRILDQPGSGAGELIVGNPPGSTKLTGTSWPHYPNQALEPLYSWNNTLNGVNVNFGHSDTSDNLRENVDFYNNTPMPGYTPYVYPHPLVSGVPTPIPSNTPTQTPTPTIQVTVQTGPTGLPFSVDGVIYTASQTVTWPKGSSHTIATTSPQSGGTGVQYVWAKWSDSGAISYTVAPTTGKTYTAKFNTQYFLTKAAGIGGTVTPASGWKASGSSVKITATPKTGYSFTGWSGTGTGSFSGTTNPVNITMSGPVTETATFTQNSSPTPTPTPTPTNTPTPTPTPTDTPTPTPTPTDTPTPTPTDTPTPTPTDTPTPTPSPSDTPTPTPTPTDTPTPSPTPTDTPTPTATP